MNSDLTAPVVDEIKKKARERLGEIRKTNDIIGQQIFSIIGLYARVIYYPLGEKAPWGFTRISGNRNYSGLEKPFVAINTSIPVYCQVFAAAHELYHIWYEKKPDILPSTLIDECGQDLCEKKANRFAAEFLVDEILLKQEMDIYRIKEINIRSILQLSELFSVPFVAMAKRLYEEGYIDRTKLHEFLSEPAESVEQQRRRYGFRSPNGDNSVVIDNLADLSVAAFERKWITYEKLEYLLDLCGTTPAELGISVNTAYEFPKDEELAAIMEEDE